jgi:hypothetical protein
MKTCPDRVYITTAGGRVGISTPEVQLGDHVVIFRGANDADRIPFVLRSAEESNTYEFAGQSYVDGLAEPHELFDEGAYIVEEFILV